MFFFDLHKFLESLILSHFICIPIIKAAEIYITIKNIKRSFIMCPSLVISYQPTLKFHYKEFYKHCYSVKFLII